jgi:hypothetical protein
MRVSPAVGNNCFREIMVYADKYIASNYMGVVKKQQKF